MDIKEEAKEMQRIWIKDIQENDTVQGAYLVKSKTVNQTRQGSPFLILTLGDKTGAIEARVWDNVEEISAQFKEGDIVDITGQASTYKNQIQIQIQGLTRNRTRVDPTIYLESTPKDTARMLTELKELANGIQNTHLRTLVNAFLADHNFMSHFKRAPAAKYFHHGYLGGLLEHTLSVSQMAVKVAQQYLDLDGDLLLAGAILHDIGKTDELNYELTIEYSDQGRLLGHIVLGVLRLEEKLKSIKDFPPELATPLKHLILSHHGEFDFGSPKRPKFLEAFALHLIDDLDAKMNGLSKLLKDDRRAGAWTAFSHLFQRYLFKGDTAQQMERRDEKAELMDQEQRYLFPMDL